MTKTIVVVGYGPGISAGVAERFGAAGYGVALVARTPNTAKAGVEALEARGVRAAAILGDAADPDSVRAAIGQAREALGPIGVLHWNAIGGDRAKDLLEADVADLRSIFEVPILGLLAAVAAAHDDLKAAGDGAVLVTNGAYGDMTAQMDALAVGLKSMGVALANAAKSKLVGILSQRLQADGVYVGEVVVAGVVKGTPWANGGGIEPAAIADAFWRLYETRGDIRARVP